LNFKIRPLLKWRSLSTCDSMEDLIDLRVGLETLLDAKEPPAPNPHLAKYEVVNGLAGVEDETLMSIIFYIHNIDDVMQVCSCCYCYD
jgi:hypothetical protein